MVVLAYPTVFTAMHLRMLRYPVRLSTIQYYVAIVLAFKRSAVAKPSRGFPLQYRLPIVLAFERGVGAKLSRGFPLQYHRFMALAFERGAVARLSRYNQVHRLAVKQLGCVGSHDVSPFESKFGLATYREYPGTLP